MQKDKTKIIILDLDKTNQQKQNRPKDGTGTREILISTLRKTIKTLNLKK